VYKYFHLVHSLHYKFMKIGPSNGSFNDVLNFSTDKFRFGTTLSNLMKQHISVTRCIKE
jgi:hypothetical protein